jgi:hypothetical protein
MVDRFDDGAVIVRLPEQLQALLDRAEREARALGRSCVGTGHVLLGLCQEDTDDT